MSMTSLDKNIITRLPVMEHFYSIQGEGFYQGTAAYFIRLAGCDVGCVWCDVKEWGDVDPPPRIKFGGIISNVAATKSPIAVVTGGEPAMHDLSELTNELHRV